MLKKVLRHLIYIAVIVIYSFLIGCPLYRLTGINCPFCGMTRAHVALFKGDLESALEYNSLFYLGIPVISGLAHLRVLKKHRIVFYADVIFLIAALSAFIIIYIVNF